MQSFKNFHKMTFDDLSEISHSTSFEDVLEFYGMEAKRISSTKLLILCPFHLDSNPSLSIWVNETHTNESFFCFACNKGGDTFSFIRSLEEDSYPRAIGIIKKINGIEDEESSSEEKILASVSSVAKKQLEEKRSLIAINSQISTMYRDFLNIIKQKQKATEKVYEEVDLRFERLDNFLQTNPSYDDIHKFFKEELAFFKQWKSNH